MQSSLSGTFTDFSANFSHADELGGALTSLLKATSAQLLVKDVRVDLAGRDAVNDFLAYDSAQTLHVFESERTGLNASLCTDCAQVNQPAAALGASSGSDQPLSFSAEPGLSYVRVADPYQGTKVLQRAVRSDGKLLPAANVWLSKTRAEDGQAFVYFINLFDANSTGSYNLQFAASAELPQPPVMQPISDRTTYEGGQLGFLLQSSDPNNTVPALSIDRLPAGASFTD